MRKTCVKPVHTVGKTAEVAHILYSAIHGPFATRTALPHRKPQRPQLPSPTFPTGILPDFNLLVGKLSPLYTAPITNTTNLYINK